MQYDSHLISRSFDKFDIISIIFKIRWQITSWETCTKSCGNGTQVRQLYCAVETNIEERLRVNNDQCTDKKPNDALSRICNEVMCPATWNIGPWSVVGICCISVALSNIAYTFAKSRAA